MIGISFIIIWALKTTFSWVSEAVLGLADGQGGGYLGNVGQESQEFAGTSASGIMSTRVGDMDCRREGSDEDGDWDHEMVAESLNSLADSLYGTSGSVPDWQPSGGQSLRGFRVYFQNGTWSDVR